MPLADGRFGVCRVLRKSREEEAKRQGAIMLLVACSPWIGLEAPDLNEPLLRKILVLSHHSFQNVPNLLWVSGPPPAGFIRLGIIPPTEAEAAMECLSSSAWEYHVHQVYAQWRWDHEREAVLQEDEEKQQKKQVAQVEGARNYQKYLAGLTLEGLRNKRRFVGWQGFVRKKALDACRKDFRETIDALIALGPEPKVIPRIRILKRCITELNRLDEEYGFIATIEREDLCEEFEEIVYACGFHELQDLADRWRDW